LTFWYRTSYKLILIWRSSEYHRQGYRYKLTLMI